MVFDVKCVEDWCIVKEPSRGMISCSNLLMKIGHNGGAECRVVAGDRRLRFVTGTVAEFLVFVR
jgi:hypothetical protein